MDRPNAFVDSHRQRLMWSVQALAAPADVQITLYPDFVVKADELALDFENWYECARSILASGWSESQRAALAALDAKLGEMSRGGAEFTADLWLESGLASDPNWQQVRELARAALRLFSWPVERPPGAPESRGAWYIR